MLDARLDIQPCGSVVAFQMLRMASFEKSGTWYSIGPGMETVPFRLMFDSAKRLEEMCCILGYTSKVRIP